MWFYAKRHILSSDLIQIQASLPEEIWKEFNPKSTGMVVMEGADAAIQAASSANHSRIPSWWVISIYK